MFWLHDLACFLGGVFLANALPHYACGVMGRAFQTPFANPPGKGLSSSSVNVVWGWVNMVIGYLLITRTGQFDAHALDQAGSLGMGLLLMGLFAARHFGRFHGGTLPRDQ